MIRAYRNWRFLRRHMKACKAAATLGRLGGKARAEKVRIPIRAKACEIRNELHLPPHPGLQV